MGIAAPASDNPICRLKNSFASGGEFCRPDAAGLAPPTLDVPVDGRPNWKMPEFSRKKSRFSGKSTLNRVRFTCCSSASTCEKSVFTVASSVRPFVMPYFTSTPAETSPVDDNDTHGARAGRAVGLDAQVSARPKLPESLDRTRERDALQRVDARQRRPEALFIAPPQAPLEVQAPRLRILFGELQGPKGNADLRIPAILTDSRADVPDPVPVGVDLAPLVGHLRVPLGTRRVGCELEAVAPVGEGVDDDQESVAGARVEVLLQVADDDRRRLVVSGEDAEIERLVIEHDTNLGVEGGGLTLARFVLQKALGERRVVARRVRRAHHPDSRGCWHGSPRAGVRGVPSRSRYWMAGWFPSGRPPPLRT